MRSRTIPYRWGSMNIQNRTIDLNSPNAVGALDISPDASKLAIGQQDDGFGTHANLTVWSLPFLEL